MKKNDIITAEIIDYSSSDGNGIAKYENMVVFVPSTAIGDICEIKIIKVQSAYCIGRCEKIIKPSKERIAPKCKISNQCGGCNFQHITYESELIAKKNFVKACFERIGKIDCNVNETLFCSNPLRYRNKAQYPVAKDVDGKAIYGFYANRSHRVIQNNDCLLQPDIFNDIASFVVNTINELKIQPYDEESHSGIIRHIYLRKAWVTGEIMLCLVCTKADFKNKDILFQKIKNNFPGITTSIININKEKTNVILGEKNITIYGKGTITDVLCGVNIEISPHSFYQVNHDGAEELYSISKRSLDLNGNDVLLDMYCGTGSIGLSMADKVSQLIGVEIVPQAIENAKINAKKMGLSNTRFICADAKDAARQLLNENFKPTAIVLDPPRKGCDTDTLDAIISMNVDKISMISCNPATAARDCKYLCENGYEVKMIQPFDMFPRTKHVETVVQLVRKTTDTYIDITVNMDELDLTSSEAKSTYEKIKDLV